MQTYNINGISIYSEKMVPSKNLNPQIMKNQFVFRKTGNFVGQNEVVVALMEEPIWWNRPLKEDTEELVKLEQNGIYSYNLPLYNGAPNWKSNYNLLLNKNNVPVSAHVKFKEKMSEHNYAVLRSMIYDSIYKTMIELGVPKTAMVYLNNDLLLNGKKFVGGEQIMTDTVYNDDVLITVQYASEKEIFDQLTYGKAVPKRGITGIVDEFPNLGITKEKFGEILKKHIAARLALLEI